MKVDFHGWLLQDAEQEIHRIVSDVRACRKSELVTFVTGIGRHKKQVFDVMKVYNVRVDEMIGNAGCIIAYIE